MEAPNVDFIYWTFTAAAQSVAAFVGLMLAGYALMHTLMESARERDETLEEIHASLRLSFHRWLQVLSALTGSAIILSLVVVVTNKWEFPGKYWIAAAVGLIDVASIVCGLAFVVATTHPKRFTHTAERVLERRGRELALSGDAQPVSRFFGALSKLEKALRRAATQADLSVASPEGKPVNMKRLGDALLEADRIDADLARELQLINQYRNLVYHGHVSTADRTMIDRVVAATRTLEPKKRGAASANAETESTPG